MTESGLVIWEEIKFIRPDEVDLIQNSLSLATCVFELFPTRLVCCC